MKPDTQKPAEAAYESVMAPSDQILVTGSAGFIGVRVVDRLLEMGFHKVRCFVRPSSRLERLQEILEKHDQAEAEVVSGDLLSKEDCRKAVDGVSVIFHLAAGSEKSFAGAFMNSALTTRNLLDSFREVGRPKRFVNVSSFSVYSNLGMPRGFVMDEECPLEQSFEERGDAYGFGKWKQEEIVRCYGENHHIPWVILRPGAVFGPGKRALTGRIGFDTFGIFVQVGGRHVVPFTYVDNCAEAIVLAAITPGVEGEVFNVVDDCLPTARRVLKAYKKRSGRRLSLWLPYTAGYAMSALWEKYAVWSRGQLPPVFNRRRCAAEWKKKRFSNQKLKERLGWKPRVSMDVAMDRYLEQFGAL